MQATERTLLTALCAGAVLYASEAPAALSNNLFVIARSVNGNVVRYDVRRKPGGTLDQDQPVDAYWIMAAGGREELTFLERQFAYGYSTSHVNAGGFSLNLMAFKEREIRIEFSQGLYRARVSIASTPATLHQIFVKTAGAASWPRVVYVELRGTADNGSNVSERITGR
jgi:hypothetical protein